MIAGPLAALGLSAGIVFGQEKSATSTPLPGEVEGNETIKLDTFSVSGSTTVGYGAKVSTGGSRINLPLLDVPMSIVTINRQLMDDVSALDMLGALRYVSGVGPAATVTINAIILRGIDTRAYSSSVLDGLPAGGIEQETEFLDRYEVVKGAAGTLYGDHTMGGLVNRVYKRPLDTRKTTVRASFSDIGSTWQSSIDLTGPIDRKGGQLTYRLIGVYRDGETLRGSADSKTALYGTLQYTPKDGRSQVWFRGEHRVIEQGHETPGIFFDGAGKSSIPYFGVETRTVPFPNNQTHVFNYRELGYSSQFSGLLGDWDIRLIGRYIGPDVSNRGNDNPLIIPLAYTFLDANGNVLGATSTAVNPATQPTFAGTPWADIKLSSFNPAVYGMGWTKTWGCFLDFSGSFDTGPLSHRMIVYGQTTGVRSLAQQINVTRKAEFGGNKLSGNLDLAKAFSLVHPVYERQDMSTFEKPILATNSLSNLARFNFGLQDNVYLWDKRLLLVGGARYDFVNNLGSTNLNTKVAAVAQTTKSWVYKAAGVVKPFQNRGVAFFVNYAQTFDPRYGELIAGSGIPFKNLEGVAKEAGVKLELMESRLIATGSYFNNELLNNPITIRNPNTGINEFVQEGLTTIKGWELDLAWVIGKNWMTLAGLSDLKSRNPAGLRIRNVQNDFNYKVLVSYNAHEGRYKGLSVGASAIRIGKRAGDAPNSFFVDGYISFDAFLSYARKNWKYQLNAFNLADKQGVESTIFAAIAKPSDPRNFRFSIQYNF